MSISPRANAQYRRAWDVVMALPLFDQLVMYEAWGEALGVGPGHPTKAQLKRDRVKLAIELMRRAANYAGLPDGAAPTIPQYSRACQNLGLPMSTSSIWRLFGGWSWAQEACMGQTAPQPSHQQVAIVRAQKGIRRVSAPYIQQLKDWLKEEQPASTTRQDHLVYVVAFNDTRAPDEPELVFPDTICTQLGISWEDALAVAREEMSLDGAQDRALRDIGAAGALSLIGLADIARLRRRTRPQVDADIRKPGFPAPVATISGKRAWLLSDVLAYNDKNKVPSRVPGEMQGQFLDARQVQALLNRSGDYVRTAINKKHWHRVPQPAGQVSQCHYWLREGVDQWAPNYRPRSSPRTRPNESGQ